MTIDTCIFCGGVVTPLDVKELTKMDKGIDEDFKSRVVFASPDMAWDTVPF